MSEKIEPALSDETWPIVLKTIEIKRQRMVGIAGEKKAPLIPPPDECAREVAIYNASLPDDDPRKITREKIAALLEAAEVLDDEYGFEPKRAAAARLAIQFADALASYLPPEGT